jgi:hypothetical protein
MHTKTLEAKKSTTRNCRNVKGDVCSSEEEKKTKKDSIITEDSSQRKNPPELGMLLPVVPAYVDPAVVIPPSTETDHESTELWAAQEGEQKSKKGRHHH